MSKLNVSPGPTPTLRDHMRQVSPPWLRGPWAERLLYSIALMADGMADAVVAAVKMRFPNYYSADTLPLLGRERRITRGLLETDATYGNRLTRWLDDHRSRGGPYALLAQLHAFFAPANFPIDLIYRNGRRFHMAADGTITTDVITWAPDTNPAKWARWWLYYYTDAFPLPLSDDTIANLRMVPQEWNAAHCQGQIVILSTGVEQWNFPLGHTWNEGGTWNTAPAVTITIDA